MTPVGRVCGGHDRHVGCHGDPEKALAAQGLTEAPESVRRNSGVALSYGRDG
jgi:hypothetical protein